MSKIITLVNSSDTYKFTVGMPLKMLKSGAVVPARWLDRFGWRLRDLWRRVSRAPRTVVMCIDADEGRITLVTERWSWRRWRWER